MKNTETEPNPLKDKMRVYDEAPKTDQTTHWDLDYMTNAQIEALLERGRRKRIYRRKLRMVGIILGSILLIFALYLVHSNY